MNKGKFYITTTLPYVNALPHIGFALEIVQADAVARWQRLAGKEVIFNFGTDEHGLKIYRKAVEQGKEPQVYVDEYAVKFDDLKKTLNVSYNHFIRTTDSKHIIAAQEFWKRCEANGDIYKKNYKVKYCVGCELEKTDSELEEGRCPMHPTLQLEVIEEENYFFKFSKYQNELLKLYKENPDFVIPEGKHREIEAFVKGGLQDFSISRLKAKMPWGVDVPDDPDQVMYVWFDALVNYISTLGWPDEEEYVGYWPGLQVAGKDNLRQQTAIWQAMLLSAGLPNSKQVFIHGFITINGQKISKSVGNVVTPFEVVEKYGTDALRYYLLAKIHPFEDSDFTFEKFSDIYNADLANGLGNLIARVAKLAEKSEVDFQINNIEFTSPIFNKVKSQLDTFRFDEAMKEIWEWMAQTDKEIEAVKPWTLAGESLGKVLAPWVGEIQKIGTILQPFLPETAKKILGQFKGPRIASAPPLFPRIK